MQKLLREFFAFWAATGASVFLEEKQEQESKRLPGIFESETNKIPTTCTVHVMKDIPGSRPTALALQGNNLNKDNLVRLDVVFLVSSGLSGTEVIFY